jgi:hypothetical protein
LIGLLAGMLLLASAAMPCRAQEADRKVEKKPEGNAATAKPQAPSAPQGWYADCPGCASSLGRGGRAGPFPTVEECREKVAKLVAQGYPYGFCRQD